MSTAPYAAQRIAIGIVAALLTVLTLSTIRTQARFGFEPIGAAFGSCAAVFAALCWWFALRGHIAESRERMRFAVLCGIVLGGIGFVIGFIGPLILAPDANQGPLLGIFVTGPAGFVLGVVIGWIYVCLRSRRRGETADGGA